jgi:HlyD family secretion protein
MRSSVNEEGRTRVRQRYVVSSPVAGALRRIPFKAGAAVESTNMVVAVIDPILPSPLDARSRTAAQARRDAAAANADKARTAHAFALRERRRYEGLHEQKAISTQDLENTQSREEAASRELAARESLLREAEAELAEFNAGPTAGARSNLPPVEIRAPATGRILRVLEENTRTVAAGTPLLEIGDPTDLEVVIEVLSRDGAQIVPGTPIELEQWGGSRPLEARTRLIEPSAFTKISALGVEEQRVNIIADLVTPPSERGTLGDQFRVEARIFTWQTNNTLKLPTGALFRHGPSWAVFTLDHGRARLRTVETGKLGDMETEIRSGVAEGEEVLLYPGDRVQEGTPVRRIQL